MRGMRSGDEVAYNYKGSPLWSRGGGGGGGGGQGTKIVIFATDRTTQFLGCDRRLVFPKINKVSESLSVVSSANNFRKTQKPFWHGILLLFIASWVGDM